MKKKNVTACILAVAALSIVCVAASIANGSRDKKIKEFTAFFDVQGEEIDEDNEIRELIAQKTGARWYRLMRTGTITRISRIFCRQNCGTDSASRTDISIGFRSLVSCMASRRRCCMRVRRSGYRRGCSNGQGIPKSARWTSILT